MYRAVSLTSVLKVRGGGPPSFPHVASAVRRSFVKRCSQSSVTIIRDCLSRVIFHYTASAGGSSIGRVAAMKQKRIQKRPSRKPEMKTARFRLTWFVHFSQLNSRTTRGIFKETTLTQNDTFISISKQVESTFDIFTLSSINKNWSYQKYLPNASDV